VLVGVDGCRAGWLAITVDDDTWRADLFPTVGDLWNALYDASLILIDMPIGLPSEDIPIRECDYVARKLLSPFRHSSVFPPPTRAAIKAETYPQACAINQRLTGSRFTVQTWNIVPKIREIDALMLAEVAARSRIRESHPEVAFWMLAGGRPMWYPKRKKVGRAERLASLRAVFPPADAVFERIKADFPRRDVAPDDIIDALALVVMAAGEGPLLSIPVMPEFDDRGLPMEIVYRQFVFGN
jgi:predicted RNase H-like nuclease